MPYQGAVARAPLPLQQGRGALATSCRFAGKGRGLRPQHDERQAIVKGYTGDLLLAWADTWRNEHRAALGGIKETSLFRGERPGGDAPRALNLEPVRAVEQEWVAVGGESVAHEGKLIYAREIVGEGEAHRQPARVVSDVAEESFQLPLAGENPVVIAGGEEGVAAMYGGAPNQLGLARLAWASAIWGRKPVWWSAIDGAIRLCATHLEAACPILYRIAK